MSASFGAFLSENLHFSQVINCKKSVKNVHIAKAKKKQVNFGKERDVMKTALKKSQKITEIFLMKQIRGLWLTPIIPISKTD